MQKEPQNYFKFFVALFLCLLARLIPFRVPNVEPILATTMLFSKVYGAFAGFSFAVLSILLYDVLTHTLGVQTIFTVIAYGALGIWSASYFSAKGRSVSEKNNTFDYVKFAIMGTLFFDAFTGLTVGPIFFHQSFVGSLVGQIPFTALHLFGNIVFAFILSPGIYKFLIRKKKFMVSTPNPKESSSVINILNPKII